MIQKKYKVLQLEPYLGKEELKNLKKVLHSGWLTEGPFAQEFLERIKKFTGAPYAVLACNGTLALYLSLLSIGLKPGDEVILPDLSFNASASSIVFAGGKPVFVDIQASDLNIDVHKIEEAITTKTKAIMPVHLYGQACDMVPILNLAQKYHLKVVEDAAQGLGVFYRGKHTGIIGDVGIISFFADKTITTGEGAVILTKNEDIYHQLKWLRNQGRAHSGTFIHPELGMNFRMTDLQCAIGVAQLKKFLAIKKKKLKHYSLYHKLLKDIPQVTILEKNEYSTFVPFRVNVCASKLEGLITYLESKRIQTRKIFYPLHRQPCYRYLNYSEEDFPIANKAYDEGLALPVYPDLTVKQIQYVCSTIKGYYGE